MRRPRFIAEQARHAQGLLGRLIAFVMARETWGANTRAIEALGIAESDRILDVGCGHGRSLAALAHLASKGHVVGADPSELMAEIAVNRNRALVKAHRVEVVIADVDKLPFPDGAFDKVLCVHVIYFWKDLSAGLREIARVLKPNGRLALVFRSSQDEAAIKAFPVDIYRFPEMADVQAALVREGFVRESDNGLTTRDLDRSSTPHLVLARRVVH